MSVTNIIMAWSECQVKIGQTGSNDAMASSLTDIGTIKDKSGVLEPSDGDVLEAKSTGGHTVAKEAQEGGFALTVRVIEPTASLIALLGLASAEADGVQNITTHLVSGYWSVELTPKNVGAKGIRAPKTEITYKPGWSEEEGNYADITFTFLLGVAGYWYSRFTKPAPTP